MPATTRRPSKEAEAEYGRLKADAEASLSARKSRGKSKATKAEGLFQQVHGCIRKRLNGPRHRDPQAHKFDSLEHPCDRAEPVFEAYAQHKTPGAYRVFWCHGPKKGHITVIAITPYP